MTDSAQTLLRREGHALDLASWRQLSSVPRMSFLLYHDPALFWTALGTILTGLGLAWAVYTYYWKRKDDAGAGATDKPTTQFPPARSSIVQMKYFLHASLHECIELTNLGHTNIGVQAMIITTNMFRDPPVKSPDMDESIVPQRSTLIPLHSKLRDFFDENMSVQYRTGELSRDPDISVSFRCVTAGGQFNTKSFWLTGKVRDSRLIELRPIHEK
jgi:hypothetical protein